VKDDVVDLEMVEFVYGFYEMGWQQLELAQGISVEQGPLVTCPTLDTTKAAPHTAPHEPHL
jgi:hypothetical protein